MKFSPLAVAVAAAFSLSAVAQTDKPQSQGAQPSTQGQSAQSSPSSDAGKSSSASADKSPSASAGKSSQAQGGGQNQQMVKQAQEKLKAAGHEVGPVDGIMGPKTQAALKEYQQSKGMQASGQLDQKTLASLGVSGGGASSSASSGQSGSASAGATADKPTEKPGGASPGGASPGGAAGGGEKPKQ